MRTDLKREAYIKTVQPTSYTLVSMQIIQTVNDMLEYSGRPPFLGDLLDALIAESELSNSNPRAARHPRKYWEHVVAKELQNGGCLQYMSEE